MWWLVVVVPMNNSNLLRIGGGLIINYHPSGCLMCGLNNILLGKTDLLANLTSDNTATQYIWL